MQPTLEQIAKLPKWAQEHIADLDRRVVIAERALNEYNDSQTHSKFYYEDYVCVGGGSPQYFRRYIQTSKITVEHEGVQVDVLIRGDDPKVEIGWSDPTHLCRQVAMVPKSFQQIQIIHPSKIRG